MSRALFVLPLFGFAACSTTEPPHPAPGKTDSETVLVTYHAKTGKESELQAALARAWEIYRSKPLVFARPHVVVRETEDGGKTRFVEVLTWISRSGPEHAPDAVKAIWSEEQALCEERNGHPGIDIAEVDLLVPAPK